MLFHFGCYLSRKKAEKGKICPYLNRHTVIGARGMEGDLIDDCRCSGRPALLPIVTLDLHEMA